MIDFPKCKQLLHGNYRKCWNTQISIVKVGTFGKYKKQLRNFLFYSILIEMAKNKKLLSEK